MSRTHTLAWVAVLACACSTARPRAPEPTAPEPTVAERIDRVAREANTLSSFVAEYVFSTPDEADSTFHIVYQAPDRMRVDLGKTMRCRFLEGAIDVRMHAPAKGDEFAHVEYVEPCRERIRHVEAALADGPLGRGGSLFATESIVPYFNIRTRPPAHGDAGGMDLQFGIGARGGDLLGWLRDLGRRDDGVLLDGDHVCFPDVDGTRLVLSLRTGFIESAEHPKPEGRSSMRLQRLELNPDLDRGAFELEAPDPNSTDRSRTWAVQFHVSDADATRGRLLTHVDALVARGDVAWDEAAKAHLQRVLGALHEGTIALVIAPWFAGMERWIEDVGASLDHARSSVSVGERWTEERLAARTQEARTQLEEAVIRAAEGCPRSMLTRSLGPRAVGHLEGLEGLERAAFDGALERAIHQRLLGAFEERLAPRPR